MDNNNVQEIYTEKASFYQIFFIDFLGWGRRLEVFFRQHNYLRSNIKILDAGCGTGVITKILDNLAREKGFEKIMFNAFDLTPAMLEIFQKWLSSKEIKNVAIQQADILHPENLPDDWQEYDIIFCSAMLEYIPKNKLKDALNNLKYLLKKDGKLLVFITKRNFITKFIKWWWKSNIYNEMEIRQIFHDAGFRELKFIKFAKKWFGSTMAIEVNNK